MSALAAAGILAVSAPRPAAAEEPPANATEHARQRYRDGALAYAEGRFKDAIDLFLDADRIAHNPAFAYNIGLAYDQLGDAPNALRWYREYLRGAPDAPDRAEIEPRIADAEKRLRERGVQQVTVLSAPDGATVAIDGKPLGVTPWTTELPPGRHSVTLELRGYSDAAQPFDLPADRAVDVVVQLQAIADPPPAAPASVAAAPAVVPSPDSPPPVADAPSPRIGPLTWAALGVGVAGLGTALVFEFGRSAAVDDARQASTNLRGKERYDAATSKATIARVALGVGAAFAAAGGVLLYIDLSSTRADGPHAGAALGCEGGSCGVALDGTF